jgi:dUTPase
MQRNGEENIFALLFPRSSISSKTNLILANSIGLIDPSYRQSLKFRFKYIFQPEDLVSVADKFAIKINEKKLYKVGERIGQTVFVRNLNVEFNYVEQLIGSARSGFGSTGD